MHTVPRVQESSRWTHETNFDCLSKLRNEFLSLERERLLFTRVSYGSFSGDVGPKLSVQTSRRQTSCIKQQNITG
jgi:hypothetical protein